MSGMNVFSCMMTWPMIQNIDGRFITDTKVANYHNLRSSHSSANSYQQKNSLPYTAHSLIPSMPLMAAASTPSDTAY